MAQLEQTIRETAGVIARLHLERNISSVYPAAIGHTLIQSQGIPKLVIPGHTDPRFNPANARDGQKTIVGDVAIYASGEMFFKGGLVDDRLTEDSNALLGDAGNILPTSQEIYAIFSPPCTHTPFGYRSKEVDTEVPTPGIRGWFGAKTTETTTRKDLCFDPPKEIKHSEIVPGGLDENVVVLQIRGRKMSYDPTDGRTTFNLINLFLPELPAYELASLAIDNPTEFARICRDTIHEKLGIGPEFITEKQNHLHVPKYLLAPEKVLSSVDGNLSFRDLLKGGTLAYEYKKCK